MLLNKIACIDNFESQRVAHSKETSSQKGPSNTNKKIGFFGHVNQLASIRPS